MKVDESGVQQFGQVVKAMPGLLRALLEAPTHTVAEHPSVPNVPGVYMFSERDRPVYVGHSRKLRERLRNHTVLSARQNQASFAFNIARREAHLAGLDGSRP